MFKEAYHPKAFLSRRRNVRPGLVARTRIVALLERRSSNTKTLVQETGLTYVAVLHHLHLLEVEDIVLRKGKKPYSWELTGAGQQRLTNLRGK